MHSCNYYCRGDLHCDVYFTSPSMTAAGIWQTLGYFRGLKVDRAEPCQEPPPRKWSTDVIAGDPAQATVPWLVFWR